MKNKTKKNIILEGLDDKLELSKVSEIKLSEKEFIYLDKLSDGTWRLAYTAKTIPDIKKLESLKIERIS